ncbi:MAG: formimidoylglutamase [Bdellovibrionales bacterium]|nr:formimidoylglutamase [Bdellovibrionales bacterium]
MELRLPNFFVKSSVREMMQPRKWTLIGVPDHQGVMNVGGRVGACHGPQAFLAAFERLKGRYPIHDHRAALRMVSPIGSDVFENYRHAADAVREAQQLHPLSVIVGGGHDHAYSHLLGLREASEKQLRLGCINLDAHLDVRAPSPLPGSGSPFYLAIETGVLDPANLIEFGIQSHCNAPELWSYVESKKVRVVPWRDLRAANRIKQFEIALAQLEAKVDAIVVSLDLDCMAQAYSPGVSAPQAEGFSSAEIIEMMEVAGTHSKVISLGIFELSPEHDVQDQTARVAATAAYHFIEQKLFSKI